LVSLFGFSKGITLNGFHCKHKKQGKYIIFSKNDLLIRKQIKYTFIRNLQTNKK
jgi:hypothetical protein